MVSLHVLCQRPSPGALPQGLSLIDRRGHYRTSSWKMTREEAQSLVGGFIYLHGAKRDKSEFGGRVSAFEAVDSQHIDFIFLVDPCCVGQAWRGHDHQRATHGGIVHADLPHETRTAN